MSQRDSFDSSYGDIPYLMAKPDNEMHPNSDIQYSLNDDDEYIGESSENSQIEDFDEQCDKTVYNALIEEKAINYENAEIKINMITTDEQNNKPTLMVVVCHPNNIHYYKHIINMYQNNNKSLEIYALTGLFDANYVKTNNITLFAMNHNSLQ